MTVPANSSVVSDGDLEIKDTFLDSRWDAYEIQLTLADDYQEQMEKLPDASGVPGRANLLEPFFGNPSPPLPDEIEPINPFDISGLPEGKRRVIFHRVGPPECELEITPAINVWINRRNQSGPVPPEPAVIKEDPQKAREAPDLWYIDADEHWVSFQYQFRVDPSFSGDIYAYDLNEQPLQVVCAEFDGVECELILHGLSPTLLPFTKGIRAIAYDYPDGTIMHFGPNPLPHSVVADKDSVFSYDGTSLVFKKVMDRERLDLWKKHSPIKLIVYGAMWDRDRSGNSSHSYSNDEIIPVGVTATRWSVKQGQTLGSTESITFHHTSGSAFLCRAVGGNSEGLPWAEASVMSVEEERIGLLVKERFGDKDLSIFGKTESFSAADLDLKKPADRKIFDARLRDYLGKELYDILETTDARLHVAKNGAWYNTNRKLRSDPHGYMVKDTLENGHSGLDLEPGKGYVAYFWSNSRDENAPDLRVEFIAADGLTDLGVIPLPSYQ